MDDYIYISPKLKKIGLRWLDSVPILSRYVYPIGITSFEKISLWG